MYNAGVSPEALQQVKNEGSERTAIQSLIICHANKERQNGRKKNIVEGKKRERTGIEQTT